ncbi:MAG: hypothetical protein CVU73_13340 [Deltaproteobacteria bacterium HGW-Deltaproteobacteria-8]|jgi:Tfp pilus assembly protein PilE|nr:MAG: hypothetical protein CVU73_13340 [Deltaproteobacteria bacterium HGW-Deltaproteobacteria-8]
MSRGANRHAGASPPRSGAERRCGRQPCAGFVFFDLLIVLVILGFLAAVIAPRYYAPDFSGQARLHAARSALANGYIHLNLATLRFMLDNDGERPKKLVDLSPDYMNATQNLGDYTAVYVQGLGEVTVEIYKGETPAGSPVATRTVPWP